MAEHWKFAKLRREGIDMSAASGLKYKAIATVTMVTYFGDEDLGENESPDIWAEQAFSKDFFGPFETEDHFIVVKLDKE